MSTTAISRPIFTFFLLLAVLCITYQPTLAQFPDQFELNSFLYNAPPKTFEADFFRPTRNNVAAAMISSPPALKSQNRKFLAKTPEHDMHFRKILRQQEAATIRDPGQAAMVADDQLVLKGRGVSHSLQTSDDDVYEVESAPMEMKSRDQPFRSPRFGNQYDHHRFPNPSLPHRHPRHHPRGDTYLRRQFPAEIEASDPDENEGVSDESSGENEGNNQEVPVSVSFQSNIDHSAYEAPDQPEQNGSGEQNANEGEWSNHHKIMPLEGEPEEPFFKEFNSQHQHQRGNKPRGHHSASGFGRQYNPGADNAQQNMHFSMGVLNDDSTPSFRAAKAPKRGNPNPSSSFQHQQQPYTHIQYMQMMPAAVQSNAAPAEHHSKHRGFGSSDEFRSPSWGPSPALHEQSRVQHEQELFGSPPVAGSKFDGKPMESSWLDMGAYSSGKGAFGWYSDVPVAGNHPGMHKKK